MWSSWGDVALHMGRSDAALYVRSHRDSGKLIFVPDFAKQETKPTPPVTVLRLICSTDTKLRLTSYIRVDNNLSAIFRYRML